MWDSILSIISSILTIISFIIAFIKNEPNNKNIAQNNIGLRNTVNNNDININNSHKNTTEIHNHQNMNSDDYDLFKIALIVIGALLSIALFIKFNFIILGISSFLTFLVSILTIYRIRKEDLSFNSYFYFALKYIGILAIIASCIIYTPAVASGLNNRLSNIDASNSTKLISSFFSMLKETFLYFNYLKFPSFDSFTLILRFIAIIFIFTLLFADVSKKAFFNSVALLYKDKKSTFIKYSLLFLGLIILAFLSHFNHFEYITNNILKIITEWFIIN